jgi:branched-chain amino acid transport system permease protein
MVNALIPGPLLIAVAVYINLLTLMSLGFSLTYATSKIPNFAHGTYITIGIYITYHLTMVLRIVPIPIPTYMVALVSFFLSGLVALFIYIVVLGVLRKRGTELVGVMVSTIAIEFIILSIIHIYLTSFPLRGGTMGGVFILRNIDFSYMGLPGILYVSTSLTIMLVVILHIMLTRTKFGIAMRAIIEDPSLAAVFGVNVEQLQRVSWFLTGGLAGLSGSMMPLWFTCDPTTGSVLLLTIFAATIFGGLSNIYGAIVGSYALGFLEIIGIYFLTSVFGTWLSSYRPLIPLFIISIFLLMAPQGITGILGSNWIKYLRAKIFRWKP